MNNATSRSRNIVVYRDYAHEDNYVPLYIYYNKNIQDQAILISGIRNLNDLLDKYDWKYINTIKTYNILYTGENQFEYTHCMIFEGEYAYYEEMKEVLDQLAKSLSNIKDYKIYNRLSP